MDPYPRSNDSSNHKSLLIKLEYIDCLIPYESSRVLNKTFSRQYFP